MNNNFSLKPTLKILIAFLVMFNGMAFAADGYNEVGAVTHGQIEIYKTFKDGQTIMFNGYDGYRHVAVFRKLVFENGVPRVFADNDELLNPIDQYINVPDVEALTGAPAGSTTGSSNSHSAEGIAFGAAQGAAVAILFSITGPSSKTLAEAQAAKEALATSIYEKNKAIAIGQAIGSDIIKGIFDDIAKFNTHRLSSEANEPINTVTTEPAFSEIKDSALQQKLQSTWAYLKSFDPKDKNQLTVKNIGLTEVAVGVDLATEGDLYSAQLALDLANEIGRFLFSLNPITSSIQDSVNLFYGKDFYTNKDLSNIERAWAGASLLMTISSGGLSVPIKAGVGLLTRIASKIESKGIQIITKESPQVIADLAKYQITSLKEIKGFREFSKNILKGKVKDTAAVAHFYTTWIPEMKTNFSKVSADIDQGLWPALLQSTSERSNIPYTTIVDNYELAKAGAFSIEEFSTRNGHDIAEHLNMFAFEKEISLEKIGQGEALSQFTLPNSRGPGDYVTREIITDPSLVGIGKIGYTNAEKTTTGAYYQRNATCAQDTVALKGTAAPGHDTRGPGIQDFEGGATIYLIGRSKVKLAD